MTVIDGEGLHTGKPRTMRTWKGERVDPQDLRVEQFDIEDIAHALARQCRYNGHTHGHLSVARHCIWVSDYLATTAPELRLWGLLHDAGEAYLGDMIRPLKHTPEMAAFREAEDRLDEVLARAFNLTWPIPPLVKEADSAVCIQVELGWARDTWDSGYDQDEVDYLAKFDSLNDLKEQHA